MTRSPTVLVFDVNETLIDIESLTPIFIRIFADAAAMREWFGQLVMYSMTVTLSGRYVDFFTLAGAVLRMLGRVRRVDITEIHVSELRRALSTMPAHADVEDSLILLRDNGFRLATLTNSPSNSTEPSPLENAGLSQLFERQLSVQTTKSFKPARSVYHDACEELSVSPADCMMVAAHAWDVIGAQAAGFDGALITRSGNAALPLRELPQPTIVASDLHDFAAHLLER